MSATDVHNAVMSQLSTDSALVAVFGAEIKKGVGKNVNLTEVGKLLRVAFVGSNDIEDSAPGNRIRAMYGFLVIVGFYEPNDEDAEDRKTLYDKLIRDAIDKDPTFGSKCIGITEMGELELSESMDIEGLYFGHMPLVCFRHETRGNR